MILVLFVLLSYSLTARSSSPIVGSYEEVPGYARASGNLRLASAIYGMENTLFELERKW